MVNNRFDNNGQITSADQTANVLVVDSDPQLARFMLEILAAKGIRGVVADNKIAAMDFFANAAYDLVIARDDIARSCDCPAQPGTALELLKSIRKDSPEMPFIMISDPIEKSQTSQQETAQKAVTALRAGACDFLVKPLDRKNVETLLDTFLPSHRVSDIDYASRDLKSLYRIVGSSAAMARTVSLAKKIAPTSASVLISGESGTGKELVSYLIHHRSNRGNGPYVRVNCAALNDSLLESELFGHEKGAFTGAYSQRKGRFEMAHGGTLLLDEITETPLKFQAKLLRILEQQDFERVGGNENVKIDVRIISTTNRNLLDEIRHGRFRQDLYYRLCGIRLVVSPLRERADDLEDLVWHFVNIYARQSQRKITKLDPVMMDIFSKYHWPGNVRQLRNVILTSLILGVGPILSLADVSWLFDELETFEYDKSSESDTMSSRDEMNITDTSTDLGGIPLVEVEQRAILDTLRITAGNQVKAAKVLGISDRTLRDRIRRYKEQGSLQMV